MLNVRFMETMVGFLVLIAVGAMLVLALQVSGISTSNSASHYTVTAEFDNIGGLKLGAPVSVAGVKVGDVKAIELDPTTYQAKVTLEIYSDQTKIPVDSSASILTAGILGAQYIGITPGYTDKTLTKNGEIPTTHSAMILENLIGQLMFNNKKDNK